MKTQRIFANVETNEIFDMFRHEQTGEITLHSQNGNKIIKNFIASSFSESHYKLNTGATITLSVGEFYELKSKEKPTHVRYTGFCGLRKIRNTK